MISVFKCINRISYIILIWIRFKGHFPPPFRIGFGFVPPLDTACKPASARHGGCDAGVYSEGRCPSVRRFAFGGGIWWRWAAAVPGMVYLSCMIQIVYRYVWLVCCNHVSFFSTILFHLCVWWDVKTVNRPQLCHGYGIIVMIQISIFEMCFLYCLSCTANSYVSLSVAD